MFEYFKTLGLESNTGIDPIEGEMSEIDLDIIGCESAADLVISLLDFSLESEITSLGFNKILVAETVDVGLEGDQLGTLLEQLGVGGILEDGTENAATDKIKAGWHKVKAVIGTVVNAVIAFFKKIAGLWTTTDKIYAKINKKATEMKAKWDKHTFGTGPTSNLESSIKNLNADIDGVTDIMTASISMKMINKFVEVSKKSLTEFVKAIADGDDLTAGSATVKDQKNENKKTFAEVKEACAEMIKDSKKKESMSFAEFKKSAGESLNLIIKTSKTLEEAKLFELAKTAIEGMEKIKKELTKVKGDDIDKILGGEEKRQKLMTTASKHLILFQELPKGMAVTAKAYATMCSSGLSEVSKCMSIAK